MFQLSVVYSYVDVAGAAAAVARSMVVESSDAAGQAR